MKNNLLIKELDSRGYTSFKNLRMKITALILFTVIFQMTAKVSYAQNEVNLDFKNVAVKTIINEIKKQTDYKFLFNTKEIDINRKISITAIKEDVEHVLLRIFKNDQVDFVIVNKQIVLTKKIFKKRKSTIQDREVKGKVNDPSGTPLPGANVLLKGTDIGTQTDFEGNFILTIPGDGEVILVISYLGFETIEVDVTGKDSVVISLKESSNELEKIVLVGSRSKPRTDVDRAVPVDVVSVKELAATGQTDLGQQVQFSSPSFNSAKYGVNGTTNYAEPATLKGLSPDQSLVLINGKRRHQFSALNLNVTPGLGTIVTDLNSIPEMAISRLEVLRDGAAAQYGSDAIAGIINLNLKKSVNEGIYSSTVGLYEAGDGFTFKNSLNYGVSLGKENSYFNFTVSYFNFEGTNRSDPYTGTIYPDTPDDYDVTGPTVDFPYLTATPRVDRGIYPQEPFVVGNYGSNENQTYQTFVNIGYPIGEKWNLYGFGGTSRKDILAFGFFRNPARFSRASLSIFPDGYVPELPGRSVDASGVIGLEKRNSEGWNLDFSYGYGNNRLDLWANNTVNPSLGQASPTEFYVGRYLFGQHIVESNISKLYEDLPKWESLSLAFGGQYRLDEFKLRQGSPESFEVGPLAASGKDIGSSARPGISDLDENTLDRSNVAVYADIEADITSRFLVSTALRFENYSDFGSNLSGKLAMRYKFAKNFAIRGSFNKGFRAPSLGQIGNRVNTSTVQNDVVVITKQVDSEDPRLAQLGIEDPKAEDSFNYNLGLTAKIAGGKLLFTADAFLIDIDDRIVISERINTGLFPAVAALFPEAREIRFFTNHISTQTLGVDLVATYKNRFANDHRLSASLAFSFNETTVKSQKDTPAALIAGADAENQDIKLLGEVATQLIEVAQPRSKLLLNLNYTTTKFSYIIRASHFGSVVARDRVVGDQKFAAKTLTDLALTYNFNKKFSMTAGSNNVFNVFPDKWQNVADGFEQNAASYSSGQIPYTRNANQFGFSGSYYYVSTTLNF